VICWCGTIIEIGGREVGNNFFLAAVRFVTQPKHTCCWLRFGRERLPPKYCFSHNPISNTLILEHRESFQPFNSLAHYSGNLLSPVIVN